MISRKYNLLINPGLCLSLVTLYLKNHLSYLDENLHCNSWVPNGWHRPIETLKFTLLAYWGWVKLIGWYPNAVSERVRTCPNAVRTPSECHPNAEYAPYNKKRPEAAAASEYIIELGIGNTTVKREIQCHAIFFVKSIYSKVLQYKVNLMENLRKNYGNMYVKFRNLHISVILAY